MCQWNPYRVSLDVQWFREVHIPDGRSMWWAEKLRQVPTTKVRVVVSVMLAVWTGYTVLYRQYSPPSEWYIFLAALGGLDTVQYTINKRSRIPSGDDVTASSDVSELDKG